MGRVDFPLQRENWEAFSSSERVRFGAKARPSMCLPGTIRRLLGTELCGGGGGYAYSLSWRRQDDNEEKPLQTATRGFCIASMWWLTIDQ